MLVPKDKISLRQDEDGVWIAKSDLLPGCHAYGKAEAEAVLEFQEAARAHLEALLDFGKELKERIDTTRNQGGRLLVPTIALAEALDIAEKG